MEITVNVCKILYNMEIMGQPLQCGEAVFIKHSLEGIIEDDMYLQNTKRIDKS